MPRKQLTASISLLLPCSKKSGKLQRFGRSSTHRWGNTNPWSSHGNGAFSCVWPLETWHFYQHWIRHDMCGYQTVPRAGKGIKQGWLRLLAVDRHRESHKTSLMVVFVPVKRLVPLITKPVIVFHFAVVPILPTFQWKVAAHRIDDHFIKIHLKWRKNENKTTNNQPTSSFHRPQPLQTFQVNLLKPPFLGF